ncbi:ATP-binding protein [Nocardia sp. NBC_01327]|uniref:ATP-binding protein n=1 Tax=Nocardia sp. NBC_01327 TaxID=2903593 RepID=UPI002E0D72D7|nr:ATP-binding protein [Nocardia sp. NBC_01327]
MVLSDSETAAARIVELLGSARSGLGSAAVLRGDPGIGKSALLGYAVERAEGFKVMRCRGRNGETGVSGVRELFEQVQDPLEILAEPHAEILGRALTLGRQAVDPYLVGISMVTLLGALARERPLLVVADDVQWLDLSTVEYLAFAARRLTSAPIALLLAHEDPIGPMLRGLPHIHLTEPIELPVPAAEPTAPARAYESPAPVKSRAGRRSA